MALAQGTNEALIEGILSEIEVRQQDNGAIAGKVILQCPIRPNPKSPDTIVSLVPVEYYVAPITKAGKNNPAFTKINRLISDGKPLAEGHSTELATKVRVKAQIKENSFAKDGQIISTTRLQGNFFDEVKNADFKPQASFEVRMIVSSILPEMKNIEGDKVETGDLIVKGYVVQYNGNLDEVRFVVRGKKYVEIIEQYWNTMETVNASGFLRFITETDTYLSGEDGFGEPVEKSYVRNIRDLIINNGSKGEVDNPYPEEDVAEAIKERKRRMDDVLKKETETVQTTKVDKGW